MALKDQTKRAKPLECGNDVIGLIKDFEIGKNSLRRNQGEIKRARVASRPFQIFQGDGSTRFRVEGHLLQQEEAIHHHRVHRES